MAVVYCGLLLPLHVPTHCCMDLDHTCRWCVLIAAVVDETREGEPPCPSRLASTRCQAPRLPLSIKPVRLRVCLVPTACKGCPLPVLLECMAARSSCLLQHVVGGAVPGMWERRLDGWPLAIGVGSVFVALAIATFLAIRSGTTAMGGPQLRPSILVEAWTCTVPGAAEHP